MSLNMGLSWENICIGLITSHDTILEWNEEITAWIGNGNSTAWKQFAWHIKDVLICIMQSILVRNDNVLYKGPKRKYKAKWNSNISHLCSHAYHNSTLHCLRWFNVQVESAHSKLGPLHFQLNCFTNNVETEKGEKIPSNYFTISKHEVKFIPSLSAQS